MCISSKSQIGIIERLDIMQQKDAVKFSLFITMTLLISLLLGGVGEILCTVLISYYFIKGGYPYIISALLGVLSFNFVMTFDFLGAVIYCIGIVIPAFFTGIGLGKKLSFKFIILTASISHLFSKILSLMNQSVKTGKSTFELIFGDSLRVLNEMANSGQIKLPVELDGDYLSVIEYLTPSFLILGSLLITYVAFGIVRTLLKRKGVIFEYLPRFYSLRMDKEMVFVLLAILLTSLAFGVTAITINILVVMSTILIVCGVSIVDYYLRLYKTRGVLRFLIYVVGLLLMSVVQVLVLALLGLGIVDSFHELRE